MCTENKETKLLSSFLKCLKCEKEFDFPNAKDQYLAHLFLSHRLVIADVEEISNLQEYLEYWVKEFQEQPIEEFCSTLLLDQLPDGTPSKDEKYFLLSDVLPQDSELRRKLHTIRLEKALARHQFERTDRDFRKECLYCRDVLTGLRSNYLQHLFNKHFLHLGKPENLVYVDELISTVEEKLEKLICLYCEKVFKDRVTLKDHMRKKGHKRINPNNKSYDRFFLVTYRSENHYNQSRHKQNVSKRVQKPSLATPVPNCPEKEKTSKEFESRPNSSNDSDSDWSEWDGDKQLYNCLFCSFKDFDIITLKEHMLCDHQVDFDKSMEEFNFYQKIKIINYVRRQISLMRCVSCDMLFDTNCELLKHMSEEKHFMTKDKKNWDRAEFYFPTFDDDTLLCVLDDTELDETPTIPIISEKHQLEINKEAEKLSLENFQFT